jgi:EmrB/QacA subfamily drug resistance transporter
VQGENDEYTHKWLILANVAVGTFIAVLDGGIANVALPTISDTLSISLQSVQWVVTAYLLTISAFLPIIGKLSDVFGRSRVYNIGFRVFVVGSALCGLSGSIYLLIGARILQAVGASFLMANSQAIVALTFDQGDRGRAMGMIGTVVAVGALAGPAIGGILIGWFGWPSIFWVNVPIGLVGFFAALKILPRAETTNSKEPFDYLGSVLFSAGIALLLYSVSNAEAWGYTSSLFIALFIVAIGLLIGFYFREHRISYPMLDFSLYKIRLFSMGTTAGLLSFVALFCVNIMMPFYMQHVLHFSPQTTGYVMAAYPLTMALVAPVAGWLSDKIGSLYLTTAGLTLNALGFASLTMLGQHAVMWIIALHLAIFGVGQGLFQSPNNSSVMGSVPKNKLGIAGGINALVRNVGMVLGISLSVSLFTARLHHLTGHLVATVNHGLNTQAYVASLHTVYWAAAVICIFGIIASSVRGRHPVAASVAS